MSNFIKLPGLPETKMSSDPVTGFMMRDGLLRAIESCLSADLEEACDWSIVCIGLNRLDVVKDTHGQRASEQLISQVGRKLSESIRSTDIIARVGESEFIVLLSDAAVPYQCVAFSHRMIRLLSSGFQLAQGEVYIRPRIGIGILPADGATPLDAVRNVSMAMHRVNDHTDSHFLFYEAAMTDSAWEDLKIERGLRRAVLNNEFSLDYQPVFNAQTGAPRGVEALLRWQNPETGRFVSPLKFIPILEETGLINEVGEWVLRTACLQLQSWQEESDVEISMAVNLSSRQLYTQGFTDRLFGIIRESEVNPSQIHLEITESIVMHNREQVMHILDSLRASGIQILIDDFGTDYSALSYLSWLPFDALKMDRSFVKNIGVTANADAIAKSIIDLSHRLGRRVIAEGIETEHQRQFLLQHQCEELQGYLLSRPISADQVQAMFAVPRLSVVG